MTDRDAVLDEAIETIRALKPEDSTEAVRWERGHWEDVLKRAVEQIEELKSPQDKKT